MNPTRLRADAAGNRARIIAAARTAIADAGEVKLNAIARQAGVQRLVLIHVNPLQVSDEALAKSARTEFAAADVGVDLAAIPLDG